MGNHFFSKLAVVTKREFLERVRSKWFLIGTIIGPLFFAAITVLPIVLLVRDRGSVTRNDIVIIDATGAGMGARIAAALRDTTPAGRAAEAAGDAPAIVTAAPNEIAAAERAATAAVMRKERRGYLVLDSATVAGRAARYAGRNASSIGDVDRLRDAVRQQTLASRLESEGLSAERARELTSSRLRMSAERITDTGRGGSGAGNAVLAMVLAFLLYIMIILYGQSVLRSVMEEKTTRVAEVIIASVKPDALLAGKVLGVGAVGLLQQIIWFVGGFAVTVYLVPFLRLRALGGAPAADAAPATSGVGALANFDFSIGTIVAYFAFFLLGYLLYSALFAAVGAMVNSEQEAQQAAFPVMLPLILAAVFIQLVVQNPESGAARFAAWFPLTAPIIMPMRMSLVSVSALEVIAVLAGLVLTCIGVLWIAARIYRVGLLMYGKRPTIPELVRWVKQAA